MHGTHAVKLKVLYIVFIKVSGQIGCDVLKFLVIAYLLLCMSRILKVTGLITFATHLKLGAAFLWLQNESPAPPQHRGISLPAHAGLSRSHDLG